MSPKRGNSNTTVPLEKYIQQAWNTPEVLNPFGITPSGASVDGSPVVPTLRKGCRNRIIYYIGSFNPPHLGHLALIDHVFSNTNAAVPSSSPPAPDDLNPVALIVLLHGASWVRGKLHKTPHSSSSDDEEPLHLSFAQRYRLVRQGVPDRLTRSGVWVFPEGLGDWWMFQNKLMTACRGDGFAVEFVELLGPDYVVQQRPQCSGYHGVVTSNVCRKADFVPGAVHGDQLVRLEGFGPWGRSDVGGEVRDEERMKSSVWVCEHDGRMGYRIWFVQHEAPIMDPGMSSTELRRIIADHKGKDLEERITGVAMSPELLIDSLETGREAG
ncbi:hypothetical protein BKA67DRAFT_663730 [Truncatella angustata]|uniref:Cytidyltransferase-like domain-containing protein n=1 Tax=Truncatella angustata TaxID=152316 RepID=A0A9P8UCI7_9PEZI|nr:uncharacterized protein BKA67DRAFT_663730 [Truncatella angustata]KAH6645847.1 hypothetical protein BKA67DRAFT_663730 [Truncatella angustata]KAH8201983.1 hypothetical protein TruAng_003826 [Truncatella angustata]